MGIFDFVKEAGKKLGFGDDEPEAAPAAPEAPAASTAEQMQAAADRRRAMGMVKLIGELGLGVDELSIRVDDDTVTVSGIAATQEDREKIVLAVGNVVGIARVDDRMEVAAPRATFYTVQSGDTLSKIAKEHYGDAMKYPVIFEANRPMLEDPDKIYPGQQLRIPPLEG
ncbi:MAG: peptidoglycan-binding protein LysM [Thermoanaerobaculia bacterium]